MGNYEKLQPVVSKTIINCIKSDLGSLNSFKIVISNKKEKEVSYERYVLIPRNM